MPLLSLKDVRVVDPILTTVVQGYVQSEFVGSALFPAVPVTMRAGKVIEFGKEDFALLNTRRTPGGATARKGVRYSHRNYELYQDSLEGELPLEHLEESDNVGVDLQSMAATSTRRSIDLRLEYDQAAIAKNAANYDSSHKITLSGTSRWSSATSTPGSNMRAWKQAVRATIGVKPNVAIFGSQAFDALAEHEETKDRIKHTSKESLTPDMVAAMFDFEKVKVAESIAVDSNTDAFADIWGNIVILAYVPNTVTTRYMPSYGYTYTLQGYPIAEQPYYDKNHKTWFFPVTAERSPELTSAEAGFLVNDVA